jgi:hypothetical protein
MNGGVGLGVRLVAVAIEPGVLVGVRVGVGVGVGVGVNVSHGPAELPHTALNTTVHGGAGQLTTPVE